MQNGHITVKAHTEEKKLAYRGEVVLTYRISFPEFVTCRYDAALMAINKFYRCRARGFREHVENDLYQQAVGSSKLRKRRIIRCPLLRQSANLPLPATTAVS